MNNWRVILLTMVIFGSGVMTGGVLVWHVERGRILRPPRPGAAVRPAPPVSAGGMRIEFLRRLEQELDLTPAQREPINRILKEGQERTKKIMDTVEPQRREEFSRTIEAFRAVLTPAQQQQLNALLKQQQRRAREQRKAAAPPPRPPPGAAPAP
ncbi:MAG TPA: hypothetical protein P5037_09120 [Candidatus Paceibacterota bacterium]|nr:hypothetical protein [Verrucomicrobiota bacterium]HRY58019.1 hypothetical protein [Candidatus Paceibacterota bacterium]HOW78684.1 hypothetical protein [Verrucomicrobiota bacterium]HQE89525.1 hypothetical protein [Verrucomicrobiota bacterium]HQH02011.1 hypothetical protein [Verrucomicrobiota bacterium]